MYQGRKGGIIVMKIMISQPMKGKTMEQIRNEREELVRKLQEKGYEVVDTIFTEEPPTNCDEALFYLSKSIEAIGKVDGVVFMAGWEYARGCKIEHEVAKEYGKFVMEV